MANITLEQLTGLYETLEKAEQVLVDLQKERNELKAQVEVLRAALDSVLNCGDWYSSALEFDHNTDGHFVQSGILKAIAATPAQCLAEIKAQAVEDAIDYIRANANDSREASFYGWHYAIQLRQQAKEQNK